MRIGQYLKGAKNCGLIFKPAITKEFLINCYIDADFAGMWGYKDIQDPSCVKSQTGYILYNGLFHCLG
jgi:hypothetical protein